MHFTHRFTHDPSLGLAHFTSLHASAHWPPHKHVHLCMRYVLVAALAAAPWERFIGLSDPAGYALQNTKNIHRKNKTK